MSSSNSNASNSASNSASVTNGTNVANSTTPTTSTSTLPKDSFPSRAKQASSAWRNFEDAFKRISKCSSIFSDIEGAMDRQSALELETRTKDTRISTMQSLSKAQIEGFENRYSEWDKEKNRLRLQITNMKAEMIAQADRVKDEQKDAYARKERDIRKELGAEKKTTATLADKLERANKKIERVEMELTLCNGRLREWEGHVSVLKDIDIEAFNGRVQLLSTHSYNIARNHFLCDLPEKLLTDYTRWDSLTRSLTVPLSLPPTNSPAAKHIRTAAALHVITSRLCTQFFKPCYIPDYIPKSATASTMVEKILAQQLSVSVERETITRAMLLSTYVPGDIDEVTKRAVQAASEEVLNLLRPISCGDETLRADIETLFYEAVDVWKEAQHSKKMVEASVTDEDFENWPWSHLEEFTSTVAEIKEQPVSQRFEMLNLFPRIFIPEDDHIVHVGIVLWPNQSTVIAAEQELRECTAAKRLKSGRHGSVSGGSRRLSTVNDGGTGARATDRASFLEGKRPQMQGRQALDGTRGEE